MVWMVNFETLKELCTVGLTARKNGVYVGGKKMANAQE